MMGRGSPSKGVTILSLEKETQRLPINNARKWLRVEVNISRHKSSECMQTTRYERLAWCERIIPLGGRFPLFAKSKGRFISLFPFSLASISEGLLPSAFLPALLPSLFGASSNPTTLSRCLRTPGDLGQRDGVEGFENFIVSLYKSRANHRVRISSSRSTISKWLVFRSSGGKHGGSHRHDQASKGSKSSCGYFGIAKSWIICVNTNRNTTLSEAQGVSLRITSDVRVSMCRNEMEQGLAQMSVIVGVSHDLRTTQGTVCHVLYLGGKAFIEKEIGLRVADSHIVNHPEDDLTPLETIQRSNSTIGKKIPFELEGEAFELGGGKNISKTNYKEMERIHMVERITASNMFVRLGEKLARFASKTMSLMLLI
ncbi:hypothetical protein Tco_0425114 [Tanacetum coccineum]